MSSGIQVLLLAQVLEPGGYINPLKILGILICLMVWTAYGQWVDQDTIYVRANRSVWNGVILGTGIAGMFAWLLTPLPGYLYFAGFGLWLVITGGGMIAYAVTRNKMVPQIQRVFTPGHIRSKIHIGGKKKDKRLDALQRVKLINASGKTVDVPSDDEEIDQFVAVQSLMFDALWRRATTIDIAVAGEESRLLYRIDGFSSTRKDLLDTEQLRKCILFLKRVAGLDPEERRRPQEGKMSAAFAGSADTNAHMEVRSSGSTAGERLQIHVITEESRLRLPELGLAHQRLKQFSQVAKSSQGMIIVSGPKESGITTSAYAQIQGHDAFMQNIQTLERKRLMEVENVTQHTYDQSKTDVSYARQLQTIIRREPDVVLTDDCEDADTAMLAAKAAANGKKVYLQMRANDCFDALRQFLAWVNDPSMSSKALLAITNQRLVRKLCEECKEAYKPDANLLKKANLPADKIEHFYRVPSETPVDKKGNPIVCTACQGTGYLGRVAIFEVMIADENVKKYIKAGADASKIKTLCRKNKMLYLQEEGLLKVMEGVTSMNEIIRSLKNDTKG
jgi:type II secretory ATPase GspE/PulE/Tfp pilus assembly ATPase PilB-like protein